MKQQNTHSRSDLVRQMAQVSILKIDVPYGRVVLTEVNGNMHEWATEGDFGDNDSMDEALERGLRDDSVPLLEVCALYMLVNADHELMLEWRQAAMGTQTKRVLKDLEAKGFIPSKRP